MTRNRKKIEDYYGSEYPVLVYHGIHINIFNLLMTVYLFIRKGLHVCLKLLDVKV